MASDLSSSPTASPRAAGPAVASVMRPPVTTTVEADAHLAGAAYLMKHSGHSALLVVADDDPQRLRAILTDTDIARAIADGRDPEDTRIRELTTASPITVGSTESVENAARVMVEHNFHHLPVVDGDRLLGIVDLVDVCRSVLALGS
jgi:CBS domain-containing protein